MAGRQGRLRLEAGGALTQGRDGSQFIAASFEQLAQKCNVLRPYLAASSNNGRAAIDPVHDERTVCRRRQVLTRRGYQVSVAASAAEARAAFMQAEFALVLLDLRLPDGTGIELLQEFRDTQGDLLVIMMTASSSVETAVEAIKLGAYDYVTKPFDMEQVLLTADKALETTKLRREVRELVHGEGGVLRAATAGDYVLDHVASGVLPGGASFTVPVYSLRPGVVHGGTGLDHEHDFAR